MASFHIMQWCAEKIIETQEILLWPTVDNYQYNKSPSDFDYKNLKVVDPDLKPGYILLIYHCLGVTHSNRLIDTFPKIDGATSGLQEVIRLTEDLIERKKCLHSNNRVF